MVCWTWQKAQEHFHGTTESLAGVAYTAVAFSTLKLLFEDLRFGKTASLVVSLLFYGLILIQLPRLNARGTQTGKFQPGKVVHGQPRRECVRLEKVDQGFTRRSSRNLRG